MHSLKNICCVCFCLKTDLKTIPFQNNIYKIHFEKLLQDTPDLNNLTTDKEKLICVNCLNIIDEFSDFVTKCLANYDMFLTRFTKNQDESTFQANTEEQYTHLETNTVIKTEPENIKTYVINETLENKNALILKSETSNLDENHVNINNREVNSVVYTNNNTSNTETATVKNVDNFSTHNMELGEIPKIKLELPHYIHGNKRYHEEKYQVAYSHENQTDSAPSHSNKTYTSNEVVQNDPVTHCKKEDASYIKFETLDIEEDNSMKFEDILLDINIIKEESDRGLINEDVEEIEELKNGGEENIKLDPLDIEEQFIVQLPERNSILDTNSALSGNSSDNSCKLCGKTFTNSANLIKHNRIHTGDRSYRCKECGKRFTSSSNLYTHQRIHTGEKPYSCEQCGKGFITSSNLIKHNRIHTGDRPYSCTECGKNFISSSNLYIHKRVHSGDRPYSCNQCSKTFTDSSSFIRHKRIHSGEKPYFCDMCDKSFKSSTSCNNHKRTHTGHKPYTCDQCGKTFNTSSNLINHKRIHTGVKAHSCEECGKEFYDASSLVQHRRVHTGEKPYSCEHCGRKFSCASYLTAHTRIHMGDQRYKCEVCEKIFINQSHLNEHTRIHTGEKPYSCEECGKRFSRSSNYNQHKKIHTKE